MEFTAKTLFVFFSILVMISTLALVGCNRSNMKQTDIIDYVDEDQSDIIPDSVQSALDSMALENTVKLFQMWDDEFCGKEESEVQHLGEFLPRHPELDTTFEHPEFSVVNRFGFDTIEEAEMFYDLVEEQYNIKRVDIPFSAGKYEAHFHPSCYPITW